MPGECGWKKGQAGQDWALNAGGSISRSTKGLPDKNTMFSSGYANHNVVSDQLSTNKLVDYYYRNQNGIMDFEQDIFHFNFGNHTGEFMLNKSGEVAFLSAYNLKIEFDRNSTGISGWRVWDVYGNQYSFEDTE